MKNKIYRGNIRSTSLINHFSVFQTLVEERVGSVMIPFFHMLVVKFIRQLQDGSGNFYEISDYDDYDFLVNESPFQFEEKIYEFVVGGKIVKLLTRHSNIDNRIMPPGGFTLISRLDVSSKSSDALQKVIEYFEDFVREQDFAETKKAVFEMIAENPMRDRVCKDIKEFYL